MEARHKAARDLGVMITKVGEQDYGKVATKTPVLKLVMEHVVPLRDKNDANLKSAVEYVLSQAHRELHAIYKADDNAAEARRLFRLKQTPESKAADRASQAIIIYPMAPAKEAKK